MPLVAGSRTNEKEITPTNLSILSIKEQQAQDDAVEPHDIVTQLREPTIITIDVISGGRLFQGDDFASADAFMGQEEREAPLSEVGNGETPLRSDVIVPSDAAGENTQKGTAPSSPVVVDRWGVVSL